MTNPEKEDNKKQVNNFVKYTGMTFQMLATIGVFTFIGYKIDEHRSSETLIFTAIFGVVGVVASFIHLFRMLGKP